MLILVTAVLFLAMVSYLLLASTLFTRDKRAYIFDLNASLVQTLAEETEAAFAAIGDKLILQAELLDQGVGPDKPGHAYILASEPDVLDVTFWKRGKDGRFAQRAGFRDPSRLAAQGVTVDDLQAAMKAHPIDFEASVALGRWTTNASVPPDIPLVWLTVSVGGDGVAAALLRPNRLLRIFGDSGAYSAYLVDQRGTVLVHPVADKVIQHSNVRGLPNVEQALEGKAQRAALRVVNDAGEPMIGAYARLKSPPVIVVSETPEKEAFKASRELVEKSALFGIGIVLLATLVSIYFAHRLSEPLRRLTDAARDVGRGNYGGITPLESDDEVGVLTQTFASMAREIADRERKVSEVREQLVHAEKLAALGVLSAEISHEIKNPLTSVLGFAQLAQKSTDPEDIKDSLQTIERQTRKVREMLDNMLSFTRLEKAQTADVDLTGVVRETLELVRHQLQAHRIRVETVFEAQDPKVRGNASQLQQVVLNLIMNAQHAMQPGGGTLRVSIDGDSNGKLRLSVKDTGSGMSEEIKAQLFKPFFTTKPKGKGTGLGLSVSQTIIEQHSGEIRVDSAPGAGTTFTITLPSALAPAPEPTAAPIAVS